ncbi:MAG TPA: SURF1 family cytochrome oxidase biogenesis protein, partial [Caulobacteraceae bacterium]|nr:SURF1 family cytochrome oxidase biogenesis protein [Caulobacteraceae bacterium]
MTETAKPQARPGFPVGMTIAVVIALALLVGLGVWQVQRLHWKEGLLARIHALQAAAPAPLAPLLRRASAGADVDFTRVAADCPDIETSPFVKLWSVPDARSGYRIITICRIAAPPYASILVDRGFIEQEDAGKLVAGRGQRISGPITG